MPWNRRSASVERMTTTLAPQRVRTRPPATLTTLFALLLVALVARLAFTIWEPPFDGGLRFDDIAAEGSAFWPAHLFVGGPGYLVSFVVSAVFFVRLGRGGPLALAGGLLIGLGGTVFSLAIVAEALPYAWATNPAVVDPATGRDLVDTWNAALPTLFPAIIGAQLTIAVGALLALIATWRARTTPRWFPVAAIAYLLVSQVLPIPGPLVTVDYVVQLFVWGAVGWWGLRVNRS